MLRASLVMLVLAGCTDSALEDDRAYRRLVERFDTYDQCIADKSIVSCYQTLVFCANGRVMMDLDKHPQDGRYEIEGSMIAATIGGEQIFFDVDKRASAQLPGRHAWEIAMPSFYGCDVE